MTGRISVALLAVLFAVSALLFLNRAAENGRLVNTDIDRTDQGAYIKQAIQMRERDFDYVSPRNRMPLFPALLAVFMDRDELLKQRAEAGSGKKFLKRAAEEFFPLGKRINTALALAAAAVAGVVFFRRFPPHLAANLTLFAAFGVLVFKAPYVQAEVLYYLLTFLVFVAVWKMFGRPSLWVALAAGILLGLGHLTKASVLPGFLVVAVFLPLDALWRKLRANRSPSKTLLAVVIISAGFLAVIFPYISESKAMFGRYFYNVNSTFYMWCDSWEEATSRTREAGDRREWPDLPPEQLPSFSNYLKTHTAGEIAWRVIKGISVVFNSMMKSYGYLWMALAFLAAAVLSLAAPWRLAWRAFRRRPIPALALLAYFFGYYLLFAWYSPIIDGNRFVLGIFLPFLFTTAAVIARFAPRLEWRAGGRDWNAFRLFNTAISAWLLVEIVLICVWRIPTEYGGS